MRRAVCAYHLCREIDVADRGRRRRPARYRAGIVDRRGDTVHVDEGVLTGTVVVGAEDLSRLRDASHGLTRGPRHIDVREKPPVVPEQVSATVGDRIGSGCRQDRKHPLWP